MMPKTAEAPNSERKVLLETAPPIAALAAVESLNVGDTVRDTFSRQTLNKSNAAVGNFLGETLKSTMKLAKTVFGGVSNVFMVFGGLRRILGGL
jgi:hypothetical protein